MAIRTVPDNLREREPVRKGRTPTNELSIKLLQGLTQFEDGPKKTYGSIYSLAKNHGKIAHTQRTIINDVEGTLIWFEDI